MIYDRLIEERGFNPATALYITFPRWELQLELPMLLQFKVAKLSLLVAEKKQRSEM